MPEFPLWESIEAYLRVSEQVKIKISFLVRSFQPVSKLNRVVSKMLLFLESSIILLDNRAVISMIII